MSPPGSASASAGSSCETSWSVRALVLVALCVENLGQQIGHRLPHARPRLDRAVRARGQRLRDLARHRHLLGSALHVLVHARDRPARGKLALDLIGARCAADLELRSVNTGVGVPSLQQLCAQVSQREGPPIPLSAVTRRKVGEDGPEGPVHLGVHLGKAGEKGVRQIGERQQENPPHAAERIHVIGGPVGHGRAAKGLGHVGEAMGREARQRDSRERQGVDPSVAHVGAARDRLDEGAVERGVVRQHGAARHKVGERRNGRPGVGGAHDVDAADARELFYLGRDGAARVNEGLEAVHDLTGTHARGRDLYELAVLEGEAGGLGVEHHHVLLERPKVGGGGTLGEAEVARPHLVGRPRQDERGKGAVPLHHARPSRASSTKRVQSSGNSIPP